MKNTAGVRTPAQALEARKKQVLKRRDAIGFGLTLLIILGFLLFFFGILFGFLSIQDDQMQPELYPTDLVFYWKLASDYSTEDMVAIKAEGVIQAGRIIGLPGDTVSITADGQVEINGSILSEPKIYFPTPAYDSGVEYPLVLQEDEYFILKDNREYARDSRVYGPVKASDIQGKIILTLHNN